MGAAPIDAAMPCPQTLLAMAMHQHGVRAEGSLCSLPFAGQNCFLAEQFQPLAEAGEEVLPSETERPGCHLLRTVSFQADTFVLKPCIKNKTKLFPIFVPDQSGGFL